MRRALLFTLMVGCGPAGVPGVKVPPPSATPRRDEQVLVGDHSHVYAVALTRRFAFVATTGGLAMLDRMRDVWLPPISTIDGWPQGRVTAIAADLNTDAVWVGFPGHLIRYRPSIDELVRIVVPGDVRGILLSQADGSGTAWIASTGAPCSGGAGPCLWRVSTSGMLEPDNDPPDDLTTTPDRDDIWREFPSVRTFESTLARDEAMRSWQVTTATRAPERSEVWLGTWGGGVFVADPHFNTSRQRPFGTAAIPVHALAQGIDGVWVAAGDERDASRGAPPLTSSSSTLEIWQWIALDRMASTVGASGARTIVLREREAFVGGARGLARIELRSMGRVTSWTALDGLPDDQVTALVVRRDSLWIGTRRGVASMSLGPRARGGTVAPIRRIAGDLWVTSLLATGDTIWVGALEGLHMIAPGEQRLRRSALTTSAPRLGGDVRAMVRADSIVYVATTTDVIGIDPRRARVLTTWRLPPAAIGTPDRMSADSTSVWVAGRGGVVMADRGTGAWLTWRPPNGTGVLHDLLLGPGIVWLATDAGLLRLRRSGTTVMR